MTQFFFVKVCRVRRSHAAVEEHGSGARNSRIMLVCGKRAIANGKLVWKNLPITTSQNPQESRIKLFQKVFFFLFLKLTSTYFVAF